MTRLFAAASLALLTWACDGGSRSSSTTSPTAVLAPTRPTGTLSGLVFAITPTGLRPVDGATVRLEIGSYRQDALTDQNGRYRLTALYDGSSSVTTTRAGYDTDTRKVTISGDVLFDIGVTLRIAHTLSGVVYEVTPAGQAPIADVSVYCDSCGEFGHTFARTDANRSTAFLECLTVATPSLWQRQATVIRPVSHRDPF
jgi:Carboxypeptidase regulatory-like domain